MQVLLPSSCRTSRPRHKIVALGIVSALGAVASVLATPIAGALSDRTTHARTASAGCAAGGIAGRWPWRCSARSAWPSWPGRGPCVGVAILWMLFSAFQNGEYASLSAAIPDHVPVRQRATVAGWVGMPQALGLVVGTVLVVDVFTGWSAAICVLAVPCSCCWRCRSCC